MDTLFRNLVNNECDKFNELLSENILRCLTECGFIDVMILSKLIEFMENNDITIDVIKNRFSNEYTIYRKNSREFVFEINRYDLLVNYIIDKQ